MSSPRRTIAELLLVGVACVLPMARKNRVADLASFVRSSCESSPVGSFVGSTEGGRSRPGLAPSRFAWGGHVLEPLGSQARHQRPVFARRLPGPRDWSVRTLRAATALAVVIVCTACVTVRDRQAGPVSQGGRVLIDLREPPTKEDLAISPTRNSLIIERERGRMLEVEVVLPNERTLKVPAIGVVFTSAPGTESVRSAPIESIKLNRVVADPADAREAVLADAPILDLDPEDIRSVFDGRRPSEPIQRVFESRVLAYLVVSVEVRHNPDNTPATVAIDYTIDWGSMLGPRSPSPTRPAQDPATPPPVPVGVAK